MNKRYRNGLKFDSTLHKALKEQVQRVMIENKASMIIIDGGVGEGKTTLATEISDEVCNIISNKLNFYNIRIVKNALFNIKITPISKNLNEFNKIINTLFEYKQEFDIKTQVSLGGESFKSNLKQCYLNKKNIIVYDESGDFSSRGALSNFNKSLNRIFDTYRAYKIIVILCLPTFSSLDSSLLDKQIPRLLLHTYGRSSSYGKYSGFCLTYMYYLHALFKKVAIPPRAYQIQGNNFYGQFLNLDDNRAKELEQHTIAGKLDILDNNSDETEEKEVKKESETIGITQVARHFNLNTIDVKARLKELGIEVTKIGRYGLIKKTDFERIKDNKLPTLIYSCHN